MSNAIVLEKPAWYYHQAETIHSNRFNPKESWQSVRVLDIGDTSNYYLPTIMQMRLPNGELATTNAEIDSVFGPQFDRVFNNHRPIDWPVLYNTKQRYAIEELDTPFHGTR